MKIERVINNNVVSTRNPEGREVVIMGKGIGFKAKEGNEILENMIEKIFYMDNQNAIDKFKELLADLPLEHIKVSSDIIAYAKEILQKKLNQNIYITLTDHINFTVERYNQGMMFSNPLLWEVQSFYQQEYSIGEYAIELIHKELGIVLPIDEAASIALHIVNAEYDTVMGDVVNVTKCIPAILSIVKDYFDVVIDEKSLHYERFITHLKFLSQRVVKMQLLDNKDTEFKDMITNLYPNEYKCSQKVAKYIEKHFEHPITEEELAYLTVHIRRVILADN